MGGVNEGRVFAGGGGGGVSMKSSSQSSYNGVGVSVFSKLVSE